jgi:hypothetical protein
MTARAKSTPGSLLAISRFVGLPEHETLCRIATGELPVEKAGSLVIAEKATLARIAATAHFQRQGSADADSLPSDEEPIPF